MSLDLSPRDVSGVLDQLYRAATGVPRRFYLRSEELKRFAGRERARTEFSVEVGQELEIVHSILMSYPRFGSGGVLGFVSLRVAESWPTAPASIVRNTFSAPLDTDWAEATRMRLQHLYLLNCQGKTTAAPMRLTEDQFCRIVRQRRFDLNWWLELMNKFNNVSAGKPLVFFVYEDLKGYVFIITDENYIRRWFHPTEEHWVAAYKRFTLDEVDDYGVAPRLAST